MGEDTKLTTIQEQTRTWYDREIISIVGDIDEQDIMARLRGLSVLQLRYIAARQDVRYDKDAAVAIDIKPQAVADWPNKKDIDTILSMLALSSSMLARAMIEQATKDAAILLIDLLHNDVVDTVSSSRLKAAREILNRAGIIAPTRSESVRLSQHTIVTRNPREYTEDQLSTIIDSRAVRTIGPGDDTE